MGRKTSQEARNAMRALERERDTIYELVFTPIDGKKHLATGLAPNPWSVRLVGNPKRNPNLIIEAISTFESSHQVKSWRELAVRYEVDERYFP